MHCSDMGIKVSEFPDKEKNNKMFKFYFSCLIARRPFRYLILLEKTSEFYLCAIKQPYTNAIEAKQGEMTASCQEG